MPPVIFYTFGYPGAGKSTFSRQLAVELGFTHLWADKTGFQLFRLPDFSIQQVHAVRSALDLEARAALKQSTTVIYDAMTSTDEERQRLIRIAKAYQTTAIGIWIETPEAVARQRSNTIRTDEFATNYQRYIPNKVFDRHVESFSLSTDDDTIIKVSGLVPFTDQLVSFQAQLSAIRSALDS